jgi:hypothetical protein
MKTIFTFNGVNYLSPSKKAAKSFLKHFGEKGDIRRFRTTWKLKTIERAPSYGQMMAIELPHIEYGRKALVPEGQKRINSSAAALRFESVTSAHFTDKQL